MALACGRRDPEQALTGGDVRIEGDEALGAAVVSNLGYTI
jgi:hypothetical protein